MIGKKTHEKVQELKFVGHTSSDFQKPLDLSYYQFMAPQGRWYKIGGKQ